MRISSLLLCGLLPLSFTTGACTVGESSSEVDLEDAIFGAPSVDSEDYEMPPESSELTDDMLEPQSWTSRTGSQATCTIAYMRWINGTCNLLDTTLSGDAWACANKCSQLHTFVGSGCGGTYSKYFDAFPKTNNHWCVIGRR